MSLLAGSPAPPTPHQVLVRIGAVSENKGRAERVSRAATARERGRPRAGANPEPVGVDGRPRDANFCRRSAEVAGWILVRADPVSC